MERLVNQVEKEGSSLCAGQEDKTLRGQKALGPAHRGPKDGESWEFRCDQESLSQFKAGAEAKP